MKKLIYLLLLTPIIYLVSCSSGKGNLTPEPVTVEETIVGVTWQLLNIGGGWFRLNDDYTYSTKDDLCDNFTIKGTWSLKGDIISNRYFIGAAEIVERNTIIEYSDSLLKFQADTTPTADVYIWFEACVPEPIRGCMDSTFLNFNPNAQCPDTCMNAPLYGCMDAGACNYELLANIDDGNCEYITCAGCMDANALNYDVTASIDDGSCCYVGGCMDGSALNYNANACQDDSSCCFVAGCIDVSANNYDPNACFDDGSCNYTTYIPDDNFEAFLEANGMGNGIINDDYVTTANINTVTSLVLAPEFGIGAADFTGIEDFTELIWLDCSNNFQLTTLDLSQNTALTTLIAINTALTNIDLSNNTALEHLNLAYIPLPYIDLSNNTALRYLKLAGDQYNPSGMTSLDLSNNPALEEIRVWYFPLNWIDLRNGNNSNINYMQITSPPNNCIYTDNLPPIFAPDASIYYNPIFCL